jgi:hypothetical protein
MTRDHYYVFLRFLAVLVAVVMWIVSVQFSMDGFNFNVKDLSWVGLVLALSITAIELIWNKGGMTAGLTLLVAGILAYMYGIWTNIIGILTAQGIAGVPENPMSLIFPIILGFFLEVTPEPLLVWGLLGASIEGDLLSNLFGWNPADAGGQSRKLAQGINIGAKSPMMNPNAGKPQAQVTNQTPVEVLMAQRRAEGNHNKR